MQDMRRWMVLGLAGVLSLAGCSGGDGDEASAAEAPATPAQVAQRPAAPPPPPPMTAADSAALRARVAARVDSVRAAFGRAKPLGAREVGNLRLDVNAEQIATARRLGMRVSGEAERTQLVRQGRLVALGDSTEWWILRDMDHSVPYVTPDARGMLEQLGRNFHARLDQLGLPRYRMKVTSALRTDETQAELRRINSYASQTVSAHEFGTTIDVSHERFAVPATLEGGEMEVELLEEVGKEHAKVLQAELGRAIAAMRDQRALHVMMEDQQPVYHMTVARPFTGGQAAAAPAANAAPAAMP
jgi:hypothetical protein